MPLVETAELRVHFLARGEGPDILLLHSAGLGAGQWRPLMAEMDTEFHLVAPNLRGYGRSTGWPDDRPMNPDAELDLIEAVLETLSPTRHLVGHSLGAWLALRLSRRLPGCFQTLTLIEPVALGLLHSGTEDAARDEVGAMIGDFLRHTDAGDISSAMERFTDYWYGAGAWAALPPAQRLPIFARAGKMTADVRGAWADRQPLADYAGIGGGALILGAENTSLAARRMAALLTEALPGAQFREIAGAGHLAPATHAEQVAQMLRNHLR